MDRELFSEEGQAHQRLIVNAAELGDVFGVTATALSKWVKEGMPKWAHGRYELGACVRWRMDTLSTRLAQSTRTDNSDERTELIIAQTRRAELETARLRDELIDAQRVQGVLIELASLIATQLDAIGPRVAEAAALETSPAIIEELVIRESRELRNQIAETVRRFADRVHVDLDGKLDRRTESPKRRRVGGSSPKTPRRKSRARAVAQ